MTIRCTSSNFDLKSFIITNTETNSVNETVLRMYLIVKDKNICDGKPIILGTRIGVSNIVELYYILNWSIFKILYEYPELNMNQIKAAIEYYQNHTQEIDDYLQKDREIDGK